MATTTYEEEKKKRPEYIQSQTYEYSAPTGTYYGEEGNAATDAYNTIRQRYADAADPVKQAEQDARIQRGRAFWTGANLFANVIANAINANGTARNAPNMTWNNEAETRMYNTWAEADRQLKGDRRAAMERLNALDLQDAQMRAAAGEKRAAEAKAAFDINFQNAQADRRAQNEMAQKDWEYDRGQADALAKEQRGYEHAEKMQKSSQAFQASENAKARTHAEAMATAKAQQSKGYNKNNKTIRIGNTDFRAETEAEADANISQVYGMVLNAYNRQPGLTAMSKQGFDGNVENEYSFINAHINQLYASDPAFKEQYDAWAMEHRRSVSSNGQSGGGSRTMPGVGGGSSSANTMPGVGR